MTYLDSVRHKYADRRRYRRYSVDCPARLSFVGGERIGSLSDLSESGARFETEKPPVEGATGMLAWADQHHRCTVIWASAGRCGIRFDRPIGLALVERFVVKDPARP